MSKRNGHPERSTVFVDERERLLCSCDGFCEASKQEAGAHVTCRLADGNLERIRRLFSIIYNASREGAWKWSVCL